MKFMVWAGFSWEIVEEVGWILQTLNFRLFIEVSSEGEFLHLSLFRESIQVFKVSMLFMVFWPETLWEKEPSYSKEALKTRASTFVEQSDRFKSIALNRHFQEADLFWIAPKSKPNCFKIM